MPLTRPTPKPLTYNADLANLPAALRSRTQERRWVCWKWTWKSSQWTKPPFQACDPLLFAKSNDPETWGDYSVAVAAVAAGEADGIGYMLPGSDLSAIDLDHCRDPQTGEIDEWAQAEIKATDSYVETTVSGAGLRILGIGSCSELHTNYRIPGTANGAKVELFETPIGS
jgi:primase-polymerase (primpol)-like protein